MTLFEFHKKLIKIDFSTGNNIIRLENYLLACLAQLDLYKNKEPSFKLFLSMYDQARNDPKIEINSNSKKFDNPEKEKVESEFDDFKEWREVRHELKSLAIDLIQTREIRSQPGYTKKENLYEWDSEGGVRFYNGTTPESILGYAATRFEGEYHANAYQENKVTWIEFSNPIWIGISYE